MVNVFLGGTIPTRATRHPATTLFGRLFLGFVVTTGTDSTPSAQDAHTVCFELEADTVGSAPRCGRRTDTPITHLSDTAMCLLVRM